MLSRFIVIVLLVVVASCSGAESSAGDSPGSLLDIQLKTGRRASSTPSVLEGFVGEVPPPLKSAVVASCRNVEDWLDDRALDNIIVIGANPRLYVVAELLSNGTVSAELAVYMEDRFWRQQDPLDTRWLSASGFTPSDVSRYESLVGLPPSEDAVDRFIVYAVSTTMTSVQVRYLDTQRAGEPRTVGRLKHQDVVYAGDVPPRRLEVARSQCETLQS